MIVIDNYFKYPDIIRNYAINEVEYNLPKSSDGWRGYRSNQLSFDDDLEREIILKIHDTIEEKTNKKILESEIYFHCSPYKVMIEEEDFHTMKWHDDLSDYAGIIYLTPNPPENSGTCIKDAECIENIYNRFVAYPGKMVHGPDHLFGHDVHTTRMTVTLFIWFTDGDFEYSKPTKRTKNARKKLN